MTSTSPLTDRLRSFQHAFRGLGALVREQPNARIHAAATLLVIAAAAWLRVPADAWCLLLLAIGLVWTAEALNTALEYLCDVVSPDVHPGIKRAKDVAAAGVLMAALAAVGVGLMVFVPCLSKGL